MRKRLDVSRGTPSYESLADYIERTGKRKQFVAREELLITPPRLSELLRSDFYAPNVDDELAERIAALLNRPLSYVRKLYPREAA